MGPSCSFPLSGVDCRCSECVKPSCLNSENLAPSVTASVVLRPVTCTLSAQCGWMDGHMFLVFDLQISKTKNCGNSMSILPATQSHSTWIQSLQSLGGLYISSSPSSCVQMEARNPVQVYTGSSRSLQCPPFRVTWDLFLPSLL